MIKSSFILKAISHKKSVWLAHLPAWSVFYIFFFFGPTGACVGMTRVGALGSIDSRVPQCLPAQGGYYVAPEQGHTPWTFIKSSTYRATVQGFMSHVIMWRPSRATILDNISAGLALCRNLPLFLFVSLSPFSRTNNKEVGRLSLVLFFSPLPLMP